MGSRGDARILIGLRGAGKTTVGRALAHRLSRPFVDTDERIAAVVGLPCAEILRRDGVTVFRRHESDVIATLAQQEFNGVLATGGGAPLDSDNGRRLRDLGLVFHLRVDPFIAAGRVAGSGDADRPRLVGRDAFEEACLLHVERDARYRDLADAIIDASDGIDGVVGAMVRVGAALRAASDMG